MRRLHPKTNAQIYLCSGKKIKHILTISKNSILPELTFLKGERIYEHVEGKKSKFTRITKQKQEEKRRQIFTGTIMGHKHVFLFFNAFAYYFPGYYK